ncbi:hypothetical protein M422DRAFT_266014 [Sphaerobolus stellatus SS14]|nr:hypothetical protein M422DRAFT_266014 [Sphaerobolus stellatus SS14]
MVNHEEDPGASAAPDPQICPILAYTRHDVTHPTLVTDDATLNIVGTTPEYDCPPWYNALPQPPRARLMVLAEDDVPISLSRPFVTLENVQSDNHEGKP